MSENKTEKPTKKRLEKARRQGDVAKSSDLAKAIVLISAILMIGGLYPLFIRGFTRSMYLAFARLSYPHLEGAFQNVLNPLLLPLLSIIIGVFIITVAAYLFQTGWIWSTEQIKPKWRSKKKKKHLFFPLLQIGVIGTVGYIALMDLKLFFCMTQKPISAAFKKIFILSLQMTVLLLLLGLCDFFYQKFLHFKKMHMTRAEHKQELRESEGDRRTKEEMRNKRD